MKFYRYFIWFIGVVMILLHVLWPNKFNIDTITLSIYFILNIPFIARYLSEAKIPGAKFTFREYINETKEIVERTVKESEKEQFDTRNKSYFETFDLASSRSLIDSDPVLALASLRIEIEKKLKAALHFMDLEDSGTYHSLHKVIRILGENNILHEDQIEALMLIIKMCNKAVHGISISKQEAKDIIEITEELNNSFSVGYSIGFTPNKNYDEQGLLCEWEHCIERMPISEEKSDLSCPVFGHNCPGGINKTLECDKRIRDIDENRFINNK